MPNVLQPVTITTELMEHADGRAIAYTDATNVVVFVYQEPDGTHVVDIHARDDAAGERLRVLLDGAPQQLYIRRRCRSGWLGPAAMIPGSASVRASVTRLWSSRRRCANRAT